MPAAAAAAAEVDGPSTSIAAVGRDEISGIGNLTRRFYSSLHVGAAETTKYELALHVMLRQLCIVQEQPHRCEVSLSRTGARAAVRTNKTHCGPATKLREIIQTEVEV